MASGGRLFWIQDAYTTSNWFPYAQPNIGDDLNYIRNSVKVVIDAYNGTVDFYVSDPADPILATYQRIFPDLFKPLAAMPQELQQHIRYPEDLFRSRLCLPRVSYGRRPRSSTIARISGSFHASRPLPMLDAGDTRWRPTT